MDVMFKPKGIRQKKWEKKQLWLWRVAQKPPKLRKSYLKYARRMQRYAAKGQLRNGKFFCKGGLEITQTRLDHYESLCHFMIRTKLPALALWEASLVYEDLVNRLRTEVLLALLNGFNPKKFLNDKSRTPVQLQFEIQKLEQVIVAGRMVNFLRRESWKYSPKILGGRSLSMEALLGGINQEYNHKLCTDPKVDPLIPVDILTRQKDDLLEILEQGGPEAVRKAFYELDPDSRGDDRGLTVSNARHATGAFVHV